MGLTEKELQRIREELEMCQRPAFLFHDDADGLSSFLLLYRHKKEGKGIVVKSRPSVDEKFAKAVIDYEADKAFVLDIALLKQEFVDLAKIPVVWIDHHAPQERDKVLYFNPRIHKSDIVYPVTNICYDVVKEDIWIAMVGCVGDWHIPSFKDEFCKQYPDLLDPSITDPGKALFGTKLGRIIKIFNFILKGDTKSVMSCVKILTRIDSPYEILNQESSPAKFLWKKFEGIEKDYLKLLEAVKATVKKKDKFVIYTYKDDAMSFTGELSNELLYLYPDKIIIVAREKSGEMRMSLRSRQIILPPLLNKSLAGLEGYGGGHEYACGASVKKEHFEQFIENLKKNINI